MFDDDLMICGACGVPQNRHAQQCAPADLQRVADLERDVDEAFGALALGCDSGSGDASGRATS